MNQLLILQVSTNGVISFGSQFSDYKAVLFPHNNGSNIYQTYVVAPYWTDNDARLYGNVSWEMYSIGDSLESDNISGRVNLFIRTNTNSTNFYGSFAFVGTWSEMHQYPSRHYERYLNKVSQY